MPNDGPPMVENMLSSVNPFHIPDEVPTAQLRLDCWPAALGREGGRCGALWAGAARAAGRCDAAASCASRRSAADRRAVPPQVTWSDYIVLFLMGVVLPFAALSLQNVRATPPRSRPSAAGPQRRAHPRLLAQLVDDWARGTPVERGDPRYFVDADAADETKKQK